MITLFGGWGYHNLGDEAILAGYLEFAKAEEVEVEVLSADPARTALAQRRPVKVYGEGTFMRRNKSREHDQLIVCGGGYLNGLWVPEVHKKVARLAIQSRGRDVALHSLEIRHFDDIWLKTIMSRVLEAASTTVRDEKSADEIAKLGFERPDVMPDAITLLFKHLDRYRQATELPRGYILLNLLDISRRSDAFEASLDPNDWVQFVQRLLSQLGNRAVGLIIGEGDYKFQRLFPDLRMVQATRIVELVSLISSADAVFSVRMHPGLIASALQVPVVSVPYCGKVAPTLHRLGLNDQILTQLDVDDVIASLSTSVDRYDLWNERANESEQWLRQTLHGSNRSDHSGT